MKQKPTLAVVNGKSIGVKSAPVASMAIPDHLTELAVMLSFRRLDHSKSESRFIRDYLLSIPLATQDDFGNIILEIPNSDGSPSPILWSAHTDTVHRMGGSQAVELGIDGRFRLAASEKQSNCLGGDNTVGCYLLRRMALAKVPGLYIWHRGEESGCQGSNWIAKHRSNILSRIRFAIAFDRRGTSSIVTHQMCGRTASDAFADSLATVLGLGHESDSNGIYTDTASYAEIVSECTNVSAGTDGEHCKHESVDSDYVLAMESALLAADWSQLVCERNPADFDDADHWETQCVQRGGWKDLGWANDSEKLHHNSYRESRVAMDELVRTYPESIVEFLESQGVTLSDLEEYLGTYPSHEWSH